MLIYLSGFFPHFCLDLDPIKLIPDHTAGSGFETLISEQPA